jgi:(2Fe-2S) ferredoxin
LADIAFKGPKILLDSKEPQNIAHAKKLATNISVSPQLRSKLLEVFAEADDPDLIDWLLKQKEFEGSAKDKLIICLVDKYLNDDNPLEAETIIKSHLKSGYNAQEKASKKLFYYYFNKEDFTSADKIIVNHFTKGYNAYEKLAQVLFKYYLEQKDVAAAERILQKHYEKGYLARDKLVKKLVDYLIDNFEFEKATEVVNRNMC